MRKKIIIIMIGCIACSYTMFCFATNSITKKSHELSDVNHRIVVLRKHLTQDKQKKAYLHSALKKTDTKLKQISSQLHHTQKKLHYEKVQLRKTNNSLDHYEHQLTAQKKLLSEEIQAAYILGRESTLKIILNQQDPEKLSRYLQYYSCINQARYHEIQKIKGTVEKIHSLASSLKSQQYKLEKTRHQQEKQEYGYVSEKHYRKVLLNKISLTIQYNSHELNKLEADKARLQKTINDLRHELAFGYAPGVTFSKMHHKLIQPLPNGHIVQQYNQILAGHLRSTGILIAPSRSNQVHAIFPGKVIFADWLKDFGLLVILQHGKNYMSLYAHNENLYVKTGEMVKAGQVIGSLDTQKHHTDHDLYFEIRYKQKPLNPTRWFKKI